MGNQKVEGAWGVKRKGREGEGKVADPHQRNFLRMPLEYYWHWANVTPTIVLQHDASSWADEQPPIRQHDANRIPTNFTTVAQPYRLRWPYVTPSQLGCVGAYRKRSRLRLRKLGQDMIYVKTIH